MSLNDSSSARANSSTLSCLRVLLGLPSFSVRSFTLLHTKVWSASQSAPMTLVTAFGAGKARASGKDQVKLVPVKAEQHYKL